MSTESCNHADCVCDEGDGIFVVIMVGGVVFDGKWKKMEGSSLSKKVSLVMNEVVFIVRWRLEYGW